MEKEGTKSSRSKRKAGLISLGGRTLNFLMELSISLLFRLMYECMRQRVLGGGNEGKSGVYSPSLCPGIVTGSGKKGKD